MANPTPQDLAVKASADADAISAKANTLNTSQLHFAAWQAHQAAAAAWQAAGTSTAKTAIAQSTATNHLTTANSLKAAGK
jgi:hypothetical protein